MQNHALVMEMLRRKALSNGVLDTRARYNHPSFPPATFLTTLTQQKRFEKYISNEFPSLNPDPPVSTTNHKPLRKEINATVANSLNAAILAAAQVGPSQWVCKAIFPDKALPVPFDALITSKNVGTGQRSNFLIFQNPWGSVTSKTGSTTWRTPSEFNTV
jgi:hypothetical protein